MVELRVRSICVSQSSLLECVESDSAVLTICFVSDKCVAPLPSSTSDTNTYTAYSQPAYNPKQQPISNRPPQNIEG